MRSLLFILSLVFCSSLLGAAFLHGLQVASRLFVAQPLLVWSLPLIGLLSVWVSKRLSLPESTRTILTSSNPGAEVSWLSAPSLVLSSCLSQLGGAATGREGTAIQFGHLVSVVLKTKLRPLWSSQTCQRMGWVAGFASVFGAPWAAVAFALETRLEVDRPRRWSLTPGLVLVAWASFFLTQLWQVPHTNFPHFAMSSSWLGSLGPWLVVAVTSALVGRFFLAAKDALKKLIGELRPEWAVVITSLTVAILTTMLPSPPRWNGLGLDLWQLAQTGGADLFDVFGKSIFTLLSTAGGLKGGEVTPLLSIGAALGGSLSPWLELPAASLASLGVVGLFSSVTRRPLTSGLLGAQFFGWGIFAPALLVAVVAQILSPKKSLF